MWFANLGEKIGRCQEITEEVGIQDLVVVF